LFALVAVVVVAALVVLVLLVAAMEGLAISLQEDRQLLSLDRVVVVEVPQTHRVGMEQAE
jgi:hypothetical protein